ncbi:jhy protein homolog [Engystomops pustulosus]|uniref:jhy protein homolog n=1 Tax=Engystomops pustulosus TaxID=76066 RepID=UPI003AFAC08E
METLTAESRAALGVWLSLCTAASEKSESIMETINTEPSLQAAKYGSGDMELHLSSDSLEDSDTDSLCEERRYQSDLQNRIQRNHKVIFQAEGGNRDSQGEVTAGDTEDLSHQGKEANPQNRSQEIRTSYSELRYDPNWRKHQNFIHKAPQDEEEYLEVFSNGSEECSPDEMTLDPRGDTDSVDSHPFWKPLSDMASKNQKIIAVAKLKYKEGDQIKKHGTQLDKANKKNIIERQEASQKHIIEKNKVTLGMHREKSKSYLHIHKKKIEEIKTEQPTKKSDMQPIEDLPHLHEKVRLPKTFIGSGSYSSHIHEKRPNTLHVTDPLSDINASQWNEMELYSGEYDKQYLAIPTYQDRCGDLFATYSTQENLKIYNEGLYYPHIRPSDMRYGLHVMEKMEGVHDLEDKDMYPRLSKTDASINPEPHEITSNNPKYIFIPNHITSQANVPTSKSATLSSDNEGSLINKSSNERTKSCPSGVRKMTEKQQKRLKSFLNQEVKLGGLGPVHTISEEKKEQIKRQKEYAKVIQEQNRNKPIKHPETQVTENSKNKSTRQKSLEYAKKVPRPQQVPKVSSEKSADVQQTRAMSYDSLFPQMKLLEDLQIRHEKEKMAVAALNALHIL